MKNNIYHQVSKILGGRRVALNTATCVIAAVFVGLISVGYSHVFSQSESLALRAVNELYWPFFILASVVFFLGSVAVCDLYAPKASGDGVTQVLEALDVAHRHDRGADLKRRLSTRTSIVKIISSLLAVLGGGALGREGPTVQITSGVFASFARKLRVRDPSTDVQMWLIAGGAAGLAAAFNTPLGGIVFAVEELAGRSFSRLRTYVLVAVTAAGLTAQGLLGPYLLLGYPRMTTLAWNSVLPLALTATICGICAALLRHLSTKGRIFRKSISLKQKYFLTASCAVGVALIALRYRQDSMGGGIEHMSHLLFERDHYLRFDSVVARFMATLLSTISGVAGGLLAPALSLGACIGNSLGALFSNTDMNLLAIGGAVAFLAGSTWAPFTAIVLVIEMTDRHSNIFTVMMAAVVGYVVSLAAMAAFTGSGHQESTTTPPSS